MPIQHIKLNKNYCFYKLLFQNFLVFPLMIHQVFEKVNEKRVKTNSFRALQIFLITLLLVALSVITFSCSE